MVEPTVAQDLGVLVVLVARSVVHAIRSTVLPSAQIVQAWAGYYLHMERGSHATCLGLAARFRQVVRSHSLALA